MTVAPFSFQKCPRRSLFKLILPWMLVTLVANGLSAQSPVTAPPADPVGNLVTAASNEESRKTVAEISELQTYAVTKTFDDSPFDYQMKLTATRRGYRIYRITYPSPMVTPIVQNNTVPADYYLPDGIDVDSKPRPAVICLHILEGNFELVRILCSSLASQGIPAIMFKLPYYGERALPGGERALARNVTRFGEAMSQCFLDVRRTLDMLASRPEILPEQIGIAGISLGGIVSAAAAGNEPRLERAALILAGGDLLTIIHHARETAELSQTLRALPVAQRTKVEQAIVAVDPLTLAPGLRERALDGKVLMINATQDNVIPPATTRKLASALGMEDQVKWLAGLGHYTAMAKLPEVIHQTVNFFAVGLPDDVVRPIAHSPADDPLNQVVHLIAQAGSLFSVPIDANDGKQVALHATITDPQGKSYQGQFHLVRGAGNQFRLQWKVPLLGEALVGQGEYPWMATPVTVFRGVEEENNSNNQNFNNPMTFANPEYLARIKMVTSVMTTLPLAPHILEQVIGVNRKIAANRQSTLLIEPLHKLDSEDQIRILFAHDGTTPQSITFHLAGFQGQITIETWQYHIACDPMLFLPPADLSAQNVTPENVYRLYAMLFNAAFKWTD
ncbi:MAG: dienelactone hydrolase family protein [Pirellulales bacterium]